MKTIANLFLVGLIFLSSCTNEKEEIANYTRCFFASFTDSTYGIPTDYYQSFDSLAIEKHSDAVDVDPKNIKEKGNEFEVHCLNSYTDKSGTFRQDSIILYIQKKAQSEYCIVKSKGLVHIDDDYLWFGYATGAFTYGHSLTDYELAKRKVFLAAMMLHEYYSWKMRLLEQVKILNWSWETSYSGDAHGEGRVVNNLDIPISDLSYKITYYDRNHSFMAEDDGNISKTLAPGEKYNFSFWSSNAKNPSRAKLELEFSDKLIYKLVKGKHYYGYEYDDFIKKYDSPQPNTSQKSL